MHVEGIDTFKVSPEKKDFVVKRSNSIYQRIRIGKSKCEFPATEASFA